MIRDNVKLICKMQGRKLSEIADALNITRQSLHRFLTGSPNLDTVERIAAALNVPAWIILHPAPAAALIQARTQADQAQEGRQAARLICPFCGRPVTVQITPAEGVKPNAAPVVPSSDPDEDSDQDATNDRPETATADGRNQD